LAIRLPNIEEPQTEYGSRSAGASTTHPLVDFLMTFMPRAHTSDAQPSERMTTFGVREIAQRTSISAHARD
jgi:hypothetical protein